MGVGIRNRKEGVLNAKKEFKFKKTSEDSGLTPTMSRHLYLPADIALMLPFPPSLPFPLFIPFPSVSGVRPRCTPWACSGCECGVRASLLEV
eukprot:scaffold253698_cov34-Tisochrysis_lutea.AAC.1